MRFKNRKSAAHRLAKELSDYKNKSSTLVLGISNGGVKTASYVANQLNVSFAPLMVEHLHFPENPNAVFGAVTERDVIHYVGQGHRSLSTSTLNDIVAEKEGVIEKNINKYRHHHALPFLKHKTVIIVDDGISTGAKMQAAIQYCKNERAAKIVVAVPIAGTWITEEIGHKVDEVIVLEPVSHYFSVAESYQHYPELTAEAMGTVIQAWDTTHLPPEMV